MCIFWQFHNLYQLAQLTVLSTVEIGIHSQRQKYSQLKLVSDDISFVNIFARHHTLQEVKQPDIPDRRIWELLCSLAHHCLVAVLYT